MDTDGVVGTERVEGVCSTYKQTTVLAEQNLDEITALSLKKNNKKKQTKKTHTQKHKKEKDLREGGNHKVQGNVKRAVLIQI